MQAGTSVTGLSPAARCLLQDFSNAQCAIVDIGMHYLRCGALALSGRVGAAQGLRYWVRQPKAGDRYGTSATAEEPQTPLVFLHGVGLGMVSSLTSSLSYAITQ